MRTYICRTPGDTFGFDAAVSMGDVDGDRTIDLLITSGWSAVHRYHSGRVCDFERRSPMSARRSALLVKERTAAGRHRETASAGTEEEHHAHAQVVWRR